MPQYLNDLHQGPEGLLYAIKHIREQHDDCGSGDDGGPCGNFDDCMTCYLDTVLLDHGEDRPALREVLEEQYAEEVPAEPPTESVVTGAVEVSTDPLKLYLVIGREYHESSEVLHVFTNPVLAEQQLAECNLRKSVTGPRYDAFEIEEYEAQSEVTRWGWTTAEILRGEHRPKGVGS